MAIPDNGITLILVVETLAPYSLTMKESTLGLPVLPGIEVFERPSDMMPAPGFPLDATTVTKRYLI